MLAVDCLVASCDFSLGKHCYFSEVQDPSVLDQQHFKLKTSELRCCNLSKFKLHLQGSNLDQSPVTRKKHTPHSTWTILVKSYRQLGLPSELSLWLNSTPPLHPCLTLPRPAHPPPPPPPPPHTMLFHCAPVQATLYEGGGVWILKGSYSCDWAGNNNTKNNKVFRVSLLLALTSDFAMEGYRHTVYQTMSKVDGKQKTHVFALKYMSPQRRLAKSLGSIPPPMNANVHKLLLNTDTNLCQTANFPLPNPQQKKKEKKNWTELNIYWSEVACFVIKINSIRLSKCNKY